MSTPAPLDLQRRRFAVLVPVVAGLGVLFAVLLEPSWFPLGVRESVSAVGFLVAGLVATVGCALRARATAGRRGRSWRLFTLAGSVAVLGNLYVAATGAPPAGSPSDVSNVSILIALLLSIGGLLSFPTVRRRGLDLVLMVLDGLVAGAAVIIIATVLVYSELLDATPSDLADQSSALLFPVLDVVLATGAVLLVLRTAGADRPSLALVGAGFISYAVADMAFAVLTAQDRFHFGTPLDLGWIAGYLVIGLAAWYPSIEHDGATEPEHDVGTTDPRATLLVFCLLVSAAVVQLFAGNGGSLPTAQILVWLVLVLAAGARQMLTSHDHAVLRRSLERRVRDQTADLRRMARETEVLLTSVGDGIYGVDDEGRITFVNPSGATALGFAPDRLLGRRAHHEFHAPDEDGQELPWSRCYISEAIHRGAVATEDDTYVRADGTLFPVEITASPLVDEDDRLVRGAVVVFRDVTARREVDRMKNEFLSVVSHELRTPLTAIRGSLGLLAGGALGPLPARADPLVANALTSTERLTRLINDLLDMERIESGTQPLELAVLEAEALLRAASLQIEGLATAERVRVELCGGAGRVLADEDRIVQTLTNLLGNAIKYSEPGAEVTLDAEPGDGQVVFRVADRGRGIPAEKLEAIFERFEQVDSSDARQKGGTGLGLAISRGIVERHGGRIWAESRLGVGTTVLFTLPAAPHAAVGADRPEGSPTAGDRTAGRTDDPATPATPAP